MTEKDVIKTEIKKILLGSKTEKDSQDSKIMENTDVRKEKYR